MRGCAPIARSTVLTPSGCSGEKRRARRRSLSAVGGLTCAIGGRGKGREEGQARIQPRQPQESGRRATHTPHRGQTTHAPTQILSARGRGWAWALSQGAGMDRRGKFGGRRQCDSRPGARAGSGARRQEAHLCAEKKESSLLRSRVCFSRAVLPDPPRNLPPPRIGVPPKERGRGGGGGESNLNHTCKSYIRMPPSRALYSSSRHSASCPCLRASESAVEPAGVLASLRAPRRSSSGHCARGSSALLVTVLDGEHECGEAPPPNSTPNRTKHVPMRTMAYQTRTQPYLTRTQPYLNRTKLVPNLYQRAFGTLWYRLGTVGYGWVRFGTGLVRIGYGFGTLGSEFGTDGWVHTSLMPARSAAWRIGAVHGKGQTRVRRAPAPGCGQSASPRARRWP